MPPLGDGYFINRRNHRLIRITEHAEEALNFPKKFHTLAVAHLQPGLDRDLIVVHTTRQGFIRLRHYKDRLGFQFWGDPDAALRDLRRYCRRKEVGPYTIVTITDFSTKLGIEVFWKQIGTKATAFELGLAKVPTSVTDPSPRTPRSRRPR